MKFVFVSTVLLYSAISAGANDIWDNTQLGYDSGSKYLSLVDASPAARLKTERPADLSKCEPMYKNSLKNEVMDIRYALGYFDASTGEDIVWRRKNYGYSPSLDIGMYNALLAIFSGPCPRNSDRMLCEFQQAVSENGLTVLEKRINLFGKSITARITLTHSSISESYQDNRTSYKDQQSYLSAKSEKNFIESIGVADIVIYNGHSRNGGGPDFNPPVLDSTLHPNYSGYYKVQRPGIKKVLEAFKKRPNNHSVVGFFSCSSRSHFYNAIAKASPNQRLILSSDAVDYMDSMRASLGYLEGFLQGYCGQPLADYAKQDKIVKDGFEGFKIK